MTLGSEIERGIAAPERPARKRTRSSRTAEEFIEAALGICDREGAVAVTARRVAREMGLSPMALYRHFRGMDHLLAVVWNRGFAMLTPKMESARQSSGGGIEGFYGALEAYARFGIAHPGLYQFMFSAGSRPEEFGLENLGFSCFARLEENVGQLRGSVCGTEDSDVKACAVHVWFVIHGLTVLCISGQATKVSGIKLEELIRITCRKAVHGA